jgi:hypothetical protein
VSHFTHVDEVDRVRARIVLVPWLTPGIAAMTLGHWILVRRGRESEGLIAHELVHVEQWRRQGLVPFLARYLSDYLRLRLAGEPHWRAYSAISLEVEARERSGA